MGLVDANNKVNFYDGQVRVVDARRQGGRRYNPANTSTDIAEHVEPWTYLKFPYLKKVGWKGFVDGADTGVYCATPLEPAQHRRRHGYAAGPGRIREGSTRAPVGGKPVHNPGLPLGSAHRVALCGRAHGRAGARTRRSLVRTCDPADREADEGVGGVEAPRGTLTHHYRTDERGVVTKANLIVGTTNN